MPSKLEERRARRLRRKSRQKGGIEWTLTNIGAAMALMGLMLFVFIFFNYLLTGFILTVIIIPVVILIILGYGLIVKDHLDTRKRLRKEAQQRKAKDEEE